MLVYWTPDRDDLWSRRRIWGSGCKIERIAGKTCQRNHNEFDNTLIYIDLFHNLFIELLHSFRIVGSIPKLDESVPLGIQKVDDDVVHQLQVFLFILRQLESGSFVFVSKFRYEFAGSFTPKTTRFKVESLSIPPVLQSIVSSCDRT